jgi:hypothetical protein
LHASLRDFLLDLIHSSELCVTALHLDSQLVRSMIVFLLSSSPNSPVFKYLLTRGSDCGLIWDLEARLPSTLCTTSLELNLSLT